MENILELTPEETKILESVYGRQARDHVSYNPRRIESIKALTAQEEKFFAKNNFMSPYFSVQTLYKVAGTFTPLKFNHVVSERIKINRAFRTNFCNVGNRTVKVIRPPIFFKPEIIFHNLTKTAAAELDNELRKILEEGMLGNFDLRHDSLIRFTVCRTGAEEFAVIVTTALLIADEFSIEKFFAELFELPAVVKRKNFSEDSPPLAEDLIRQHWDKILSTPPPHATFTLCQELRWLVFPTNFPCENLCRRPLRFALVRQKQSRYADGYFMERVGFYAVTLQQAE